MIEKARVLRLRPALLGLLVFALAVLVACGAGDRPSSAPDIGDATTCSPIDDPRCANPIDALVIPQLARVEIEPRVADRHELCRRLAIDILGRPPDERERERCLHASTETIVDAWLASHDHVLEERRQWATLIDYDATYVWSKLVDDLDRLVSRLAREEIGYPAFVRQVVMHPAFYARHPSTDWFRAVYDLFLGRSARPDEVDELTPLLAVWEQRELFDERRPEVYDVEYAFSGCRCQQLRTCRSAVLGEPIDFGIACGKQPVRLVGISPGMGDGATALHDAYGGERVAALAHASKEDTRRLGSFGDALAARLDFYEAAVDRELRRYLGWWQSSFNQPDTDLPRVRAALVRRLRDTGSIRDLQRTILTSILYTMPAMGDTVEGAPVWSSGPRKLLPVEAWLTSAASAVGHALPRCDHRTASSDQYAMYEVAPTTDETDALDFLGAARSLGGGCRVTRLERPSIGGLEAQRALAVRLCADGDAVLPPDFDPARGAQGFAAASGHLVERIMLRPSTPEERDVLAGDMRACMARSDRGCSAPEQAVRWTCVRLLTSAEFATY